MKMKHEVEIQMVLQLYVIIKFLMFLSKGKVQKVIYDYLLDHPLSYALTATADVPVVYLQQFWRTFPVETLDNPFVAPINIETIEVFMNKLANILHNNGFKITFIHAQQYTPTYSNYPHITFKSIFDGFSEIGKYMPKEPDAGFIITYLNENCRESFTHCLTELLAEPNEPPVACLITDAEYYFTQEVADSMKVPRIVMW
nr:UDP-glycosyltransferase 76G1-like [Tanacetum cinerariifolium]